MMDLGFLVLGALSRWRMWALVLRLLMPLADISGFFTNLYNDITLFALAAATFCFAWSAMLYMASGITGNERHRVQAIGALWAALGGLALAGLAQTVAGLVNDAAAGQ